ncbi:MAG: hypothetical protein R2844_12055 [Caldilineales bacterium]
MSLIHRFTSIALSAGLLASVTATGALAAPAAGQPPQRYEVQCQNGRCALQAEVAPMAPLARLAAGAAVAALNNNEGILPAGASLALDDDLTLTLPIGKVTLPKADLAVTLGADGRIEQLHGTAQVPFPSFGLLEDARIVTPALAEVGLDSGANLAHLNAPLKDDRQYLFFHLSAGLDVEATSQRGPMRFSLPAGQRATLIIDTQEPLVYLAGNVSVSDPGQIALVGPLLDIAQRSEFIPDALPLRQRTQVAVTGQYSPAEGESFVELGAAHGVDAGAAGRWLGIDSQPLAVNGWIRISGDGMLLNGVASASFAPDKVFDGELGLEAWIPFGNELDGAYAQINGSAAVPLADLSTDATVRVSLPLDVQAQAHLVTPGSERSVVWHPDPAGDKEPTALKRAAGSVSDWIGNALDAAGQGVSSGGQWIARGASSGYAAVTGWLPAPDRE